MRFLVFLILAFVIMPVLAMSAAYYLLMPYPPPHLDLPTLKAGLWENVYENGHMLWEQQGLVPNQVRSRQCVGAANERIFVPLSQAAASCLKIDTQRSGDSITVETTCYNGTTDFFPRLAVLFHRTYTIHTVIKGSFGSAYTIMEGGLTLTAKRLGACAADQKPGDIVYTTPDGRPLKGPGGVLKFNLLERAKPRSDGVPQPR